MVILLKINFGFNQDLQKNSSLIYKPGQKPITLGSKFKNTLLLDLYSKSRQRSGSSPNLSISSFPHTEIISF